MSSQQHRQSTQSTFPNHDKGEDQGTNVHKKPLVKNVWICELISILS